MSSEEVSGTDMLKVNKAIDMTEGQIKNAIKRLAISWPAEDILRVQYATRQGVNCKCAVEAQVKVHPDVAYRLAGKSPSPVAANQGITALAAEYGGTIPLFALGKVLGPWDSLIEELIPRRRG